MICLDIERVAEEFKKQEQNLNGLICNAGALLNDKRTTGDGFEVTFACHLLFGCYHLTKLLIPSLARAPDPRVVLISSGGMYKTKFPSWEIATNDVGEYDGIMAYSFAKRGQVLLAERWTQEYPNIKFVSTHPGWAASAGVSAAFTEDQISYLEPLRTQWEGAEAICWLCVVQGSQIQGGEFYLDRVPCRKHLGGAFFTDGSQTKNTPGEVDDMMRRLQKWSLLDSKQLDVERKKDIAAYNLKQSEDLPPLEATSTTIDIERFMGKWYVISCIPSFFEKTAHNATEVNMCAVFNMSALMDQFNKYLLHVIQTFMMDRDVVIIVKLHTVPYYI